MSTFEEFYRKQLEAQNAQRASATPIQAPKGNFEEFYRGELQKRAGVPAEPLPPAPDPVEAAIEADEGRTWAEWAADWVRSTKQVPINVGTPRADTAEVLGAPETGQAIRDVLPDQDPGFIPASQKFNPSSTSYDYNWSYAPRAAWENVGEIVGSVIAGQVGKLAGSVAGPVGQAIGAQMGPFLWEASAVVGPVAKERARRNGYETPTADDLLVAFTTAAASGALNSYATKFLPLGEKASDTFMKAVAKGAVAEGTTETAQSVVQQVGESAGTVPGLEVSGPNALAEGILGAVGGGGISGAGTLVPQRKPEPVQGQPEGLTLEAPQEPQAPVEEPIPAPPQVMQEPTPEDVLVEPVAPQPPGQEPPAPLEPIAPKTKLQNAPTVLQTTSGKKLQIVSAEGYTTVQGDDTATPQETLFIPFVPKGTQKIALAGDEVKFFTYDETERKMTQIITPEKYTVSRTPYAYWQAVQVLNKQVLPLSGTTVYDLGTDFGTVTGGADPAPNPGKIPVQSPVNPGLPVPPVGVEPLAPTPPVTPPIVQSPVDLVENAPEPVVEPTPAPIPAPTQEPLPTPGGVRELPQPPTTTPPVKKRPSLETELEIIRQKRDKARDFYQTKVKKFRMLEFPEPGTPQEEQAKLAQQEMDKALKDFKFLDSFLAEKDMTKTPFLKGGQGYVTLAEGIPTWVQSFVEELNAITKNKINLQITRGGKDNRFWGMFQVDPYYDDEAKITLYDEVLGWPKIRLMELIAHEYGHLMQNTLLRQADVKTKLAVWKDYNAWVDEVKADPTVYARGHRSPREKGKVHNKVIRTMYAPGEKVQHSDYDYSFAEWFADQTARVMTTTPKVLTFTDKFFARVAKVWRQIVRVLKKNGYTSDNVRKLLAGDFEKEYKKSDAAEVSKAVRFFNLPKETPEEKAQPIYVRRFYKNWEANYAKLEQVQPNALPDQRAVQLAVSLVTPTADLNTVNVVNDILWHRQMTTEQKVEALDNYVKAMQSSAPRGVADTLPVSSAFYGETNPATLVDPYTGSDITQEPLAKEAYDRLRAQLDNMGLKNVNLIFFKPGVYNSDDGGILEGFFVRYKDVAGGMFIGIQAAGKNAWAMLHHEAVHALRALGYFDSLQGKRDWQVLAKAARKKLQEDANIAKFYSPEKQVEESIARLVEDYAGGQGEFEPGLANALRRIMDFFTAVANWAKGEGFNSPRIAIARLMNLSGKDSARAAAMVSATSLTAAQNSIMDVFIGSWASGPQKQHLQNVKQANERVTKVMALGWNILQMGYKFPHISWLQEYIQRGQQWYNYKSKWLERADETYAEMNQLTPQQQTALANMLFEVEQMGYRRKEEVEKGVVRKPTEPELAAIAQKHGLDETGLAAYLKVAQDFQDFVLEMKNIAILETGRIYAGDPLMKELHEIQIEGEFERITKQPYFPHTRFGSYTASVSGGKGETLYFETFETEKERDRAIASIQKMFPGQLVERGKLFPQADILMGLPPTILQMIETRMNLSKEQQQTLRDLMVQYSPTQSFKNHFVRRKETPGFSRDVMRSYAKYFFNGANYLARLKYGPMMEQSMQNGRTDINALRKTGVNVTGRTEIYEFVAAHFEDMMNPQAEWVWPRSLGFLWWLGFNIKSAVLNLTQLPMVAMPYLSGQFGDAAATREMTRAMRFWRAGFQNPENVRVSPFEQKALEQGTQDSILNQSFAAMLAGAQDGGIWRAKTGSEGHRKWLQFMHAASWMFQATELINRHTTFLAALRLMKQQIGGKYAQEIVQTKGVLLAELESKGWSREDAIAYLGAVDTVQRTQFDYARWVRPKFMKGTAAGVLTVFAGYTQNMLWALGHSPGKMRMWLVLMLFGGLMGLPFAEDIEALVKAVGRGMGEEINPQKELRELGVELFGDDTHMPDLFLRGISKESFGMTYLGDMMGVPIPSFDLSGSLGLGSPIPILSPAVQAMTKQGEFDDKLSEFARTGAGATVAIPMGITKALLDDQVTGLRRWEPAMPAAAAAISRAYRAAESGSEQDRKGAVIIEYDRANWQHNMELLGLATGFRPTRSTQYWERANMQREFQMFWDHLKQRRLAEYAAAIRGKDKREILEAKRDIVRYNASVPYAAMKIGPSTLERSLAARRSAIARTEAGRFGGNAYEQAEKDINRLFPSREEAP